MKVWFEERTEIAPAIWEYSFRPERALDFVPGQYLDVRLPALTDDTRGASRTFSLTSLPADPSLTFILKHFALQSPYKNYLQALQPNDEVIIDDAMGDLILPKDPGLPLVFVAGGIGSASYASVFKDLVARKEQRDIYLFYYLRARNERILNDLFSIYPLQLSTTVFAPNKLTAQEIKDTTPPNALIYLSGSQGFVERLREEFEALGTPHSQIVFDYYDGYTEL